MRRITDATIRFISLVPKGANKLRATVLKDDGAFELQTLVKAHGTFEDTGELLAVVYAPDQVDAHGDFADADAIEKMASSYMVSGAELDMRHDGKAIGKDRAYVSQSFIVTKGDERFEGLKDSDGNAVDAVGAWAVVIKIKDPDLRAKYISGEWEGVSMGGVAKFEQPVVAKSEEAGLFKQFFKALKSLAQKEESEMDEAKVTKLVDEKLDKHLDEIKKMFKGDDKPSDPKPADPAPAKQPTADDLRKQADEMELKKALADGDHEAVRKIADRMKGSKNPEIAKLKKERDEIEARLKKAEGRSNQGGNDDKPLNKSEEDEEMAEVERLTKELGIGGKS